jgi:DNA-binding NtrC family response regulator
MEQDVAVMSPSPGTENIEVIKKAQLLEEASAALSAALEAVREIEHSKPAEPIAAGEGINFYEAVRDYEIVLIRRALGMTGGCQRRAAWLLGLNANTLNYKIKIYGINWRGPYLGGIAARA